MQKKPQKSGFFHKLLILKGKNCIILDTVHKLLILNDFSGPSGGPTGGFYASGG
jgi:hypothetical protein